MCLPSLKCLGPLHCLVYFTVELAKVFAYEPNKTPKLKTHSQACPLLPAAE